MDMPRTMHATVLLGGARRNMVNKYNALCMLGGMGNIQRSVAYDAAARCGVRKQIPCTIAAVT